MLDPLLPSFPQYPGQRVIVLADKTKNGGVQNVAIPGDVATDGGYSISVVSTSSPAFFTDMKKTFTIE